MDAASMVALVAVWGVLAAVVVAGWHVDRVERRDVWRRLAAASGLRRSGWVEAAPDVSRLRGVVPPPCPGVCGHQACRWRRAVTLTAEVDRQRQAIHSSPGRAVRRPGDEQHVCCDEQEAASVGPAPRSPGGSSDIGPPRAGAASCLPPADLHH